MSQTISAKKQTDPAVHEAEFEEIFEKYHGARRMIQASQEAGCNFSHDERNVLVCEEKESRGSGSATGSS